MEGRSIWDKYESAAVTEFNGRWRQYCKSGEWVWDRGKSREATAGDKESDDGAHRLDHVGPTTERSGLLAYVLASIMALINDAESLSRLCVDAWLR